MLYLWDVSILGVDLFGANHIGQTCPNIIPRIEQALTWPEYTAKEASCFTTGSSSNSSSSNISNSNSNSSSNSSSSTAERTVGDPMPLKIVSASLFPCAVNCTCKAATIFHS